MGAYVIVEVETTDAAAIQRHRDAAAPTVEAHGGRSIVRGGAVETLEGGWSPQRIVVLEFESAAQARAWWESEECRGPKLLRQRAARTR